MPFPQSHITYGNRRLFSYFQTKTFHLNLALQIVDAIIVLFFLKLVILLHLTRPSHF